MRNIIHLFFVLAPTLATLAQSIPSTLNYQGRLTDNTPAQTPVSATVEMQFAIYDAASGGTRLWQEPAADNTGTAVAVTGGIFNVVLGSSTAIPASVFSGATSTRYLQITLNPASGAETLTPRQLVTAGGYANLAENSNSAVSANNANTVTSGVYTTGNYADPTWISSLSGGKISGAVTNSSQLGGTPASGWQKSLQTPACVSGFLTTLNADGTSVCAPASLTETDPKVGALSNSRVPRWNTTTLADGAWYDDGTKVGLGTSAPISQMHVAGRAPTSVSVAATGSFPRALQIQGRFVYVVNAGSQSLQVFDVSNPTVIPAVLGAATTDVNPQFIEVQGRYAYVLNMSSSTLQLFDISNPASIGAAVGSVALSTEPVALNVQGRYAYVVSTVSSRLQAIDIANPANPVIVGNIYTDGIAARYVQVHGRYAYVVHGATNSLKVFDISNPAAMVLIGSAATDAQPYQVQVQGRYAYVVNNSSHTLQAFDVSNPAAIVQVGSTATDPGPISLQLQGRYAYVVSFSSNSLQVFDISNPAAISAATGSTSTGNQPYSIRVQGRYAFVVNSSSSTLQIFDLGGGYVQQLEAGGIESGALAIHAGARIGGNAEIAGGVSVGVGGIYSQGGIASTAGIHSVGTISSTAGFMGNLTGNITGNAGSANLLASNGANCAPGLFTSGVDAAGNAEGCTSNSGTEVDPKVGNLANGRVPRWNATSLENGALFDTGANLGLGTVNPIAQLHVAGSGPVSAGTAVTGQTPNFVQVQGRYAYVINLDANTLQIFDVSIPSAIPAAIGSIATGTQPYAIQIQGRYAYVVNSSSSTLQVFDISNPAAIVLAGSVTTATGPRSIHVQGRFAYVPNFFLNTMQVFDISNPAAIPAAVGSVATGNGPRSVHVQGRYAYLANYSANSLQIFDLSNPTAIPAAVGSVATATNPQFIHVLGRYAYVLSGITNTLQVFNISNPAAPALAGSVSTGPGSSPISVQVLGRYAYVVESQSAALQIFDISNPATIPAAVGSVATGTSPRSVHVQGRYAYVANGFSNSIQAFDLGGAYFQQLEAGGIETTELTALGKVQFNGDAQVKGGLSVGSGGIYSAGSVGITGNIAPTGGYRQPGTGGELLRTLRGNVDSAGTLTQGGGITVIRNGAGNYQVSFSNNFPANPSVSVIAVAQPPAAPRIAQVGAIGVTGFSVLIYTTAGVLTDTGFSFIVTGTP